MKRYCRGMLALTWISAMPYVSCLEKRDITISSRQNWLEPELSVQAWLQSEVKGVIPKLHRFLVNLHRACTCTSRYIQWNLSTADTTLWNLSTADRELLSIIGTIWIVWDIEAVIFWRVPVIILAGVRIIIQHMMAGWWNDGSLLWLWLAVKVADDV